MTREDFQKIIKLRSGWNIDKRKGDYKLPSGEYLSSYLEDLVKSQMKIDNLLINNNGDLCFGNIQNDICYVHTPFSDIEFCTVFEMENRIDRIIKDMLY